MGEKFMEDMLGKLPLEEQEESRKIAKAQLHFAKENYNETIDLLSSVQVTQAIKKINVRRMLLMCYYKIYDKTPLFVSDQIKNFMDFVRYNKSNLSARNYEDNVNFANNIKLLHDAKDLAKLKEQIESKNRVSKRKWLSKELEKKLADKSVVS